MLNICPGDAWQKHCAHFCASCYRPWRGQAVQSRIRCLSLFPRVTGSVVSPRQSDAAQTLSTVSMHLWGITICLFSTFAIQRTFTSFTSFDLHKDCNTLTVRGGWAQSMRKGAQGHYWFTSVAHPSFCDLCWVCRIKAPSHDCIIKMCFVSGWCYINN